MNAIEAARKIGVKTLVLTGKDEGKRKKKADFEVIVPSSNTASSVNMDMDKAITFADIREGLDKYFDDRKNRIEGNSVEAKAKRKVVYKCHNLAKCVLRHFRETWQFREDASAHLLFNDSFEQKKFDFEEKCKARFTNNNFYARRSYLELAHVIYISKLVDFKALHLLESKSFKKIVEAKIRLTCTTQEEVARSINIPLYTFRYRWLKGFSIPAKYASKIKILGEVLGIPREILFSKVRFLSDFIQRKKVSFSKINGTDNPIRDIHYHLPFKKWPESAVNEFNAFIEYKTKRRLPRGLVHKRIWTYSIGENGEVSLASAELHKDIFQRYFGFLTASPTAVNPKLRGLGMPIEKMSIGLICVPKLLKKMILFLKTRREKYTRNSELFFGKALELLNQKGFVRQNPKMYAKILHLLPKETWEERCDRLIDDIIDLRKAFGPTSRGFDSKNKLKNILDLPHPIEAVLNMIFRYKHERRRSSFNSKYLQAIWARNIIVMEILAENPIRVLQFSRTYYNPDDLERSNLVRRFDGVWGLRYGSHSFKNRDYLLRQGKEEYWAPLPPSIYPDIEEYLSMYWPVLVNNASSGPLFPSLDNKSIPEKVRPMDADFLSFTIRKISATFCTDENGKIYVPGGFGAQGFRYIVIAEFLKNNPECYHHAAALLNDSMKVLENSYTYLTPSDVFNKYIPHFNMLYERYRLKYYYKSNEKKYDFSHLQIPFLSSE